MQPHVSVLLSVWSPQKYVPSLVFTQIQSSEVPQKNTPTPVQFDAPPQPDDWHAPFTHWPLAHWSLLARRMAEDEQKEEQQHMSLYE
jgi:hypothetical protein